MLYEKKMLILSGQGKGVVLIEKSAHGVKFSLRTFDMPTSAPLKAGIVTRTSVYVRDLPFKTNPSAVFSIEAFDLDYLHFAVFDRELRLYGAIGKRMWESNLMDLLDKHEKRPPLLSDVASQTTALPPIAQKPQVLPLPDGTGIPQSRIAIYGDDALAENDFYTPLDISSRMPIVDEFLDSPRVLDGLAPRIEPHSPEQIQDPSPIVEENAPLVADVVATEITESEQSPRQTDSDESTAETEIETVPVAPQSSIDATEIAEPDPDIAQASTTAQQTAEITAEAAATSDAATMPVRHSSERDGDMPWALCARYLKSRSVRDRKIPERTVKPPPPRDTVRKLRESDFLERTRGDIDALFKNAPRDDKLAALLPDLEWVGVRFDGHDISVGRSGNAALCYAVPGRYEKIPPLGPESQWLPAERSAPTGKGYWLIFQSLVNGEIIVG